MKLKLSQATRALANGTLGDDNRPILSGVKVTPKEAVVADGFMLVVKTVQTQEMDLDNKVDDGINEVIVPADALKACKGKYIDLQTIEAIKQIPSQELLDAGATVSQTKIIVRLEGEDFNIEADSIEGNYPDHNLLIGGVSPLVGQVAFSTDLLKKLLKTLPGDSQIRFRISEPDKLVEFQCADPDGDIPIRGVVMPMNMSWLNTQWRTREPK